MKNKVRIMKMVPMQFGILDVASFILGVLLNYEKNIPNMATIASAIITFIAYIILIHNSYKNLDERYVLKSDKGRQIHVSTIYYACIARYILTYVLAFIVGFSSGFIQYGIQYGILFCFGIIVEILAIFDIIEIHDDTLYIFSLEEKDK